VLKYVGNAEIGLHTTVVFTLIYATFFFATILIKYLFITIY
jgi:hypothetical protein